MNTEFLGPRYWATWIGLGVLRAAESLPYPVLLGVGRVIGRIARRLPLRYVRTARRNIELCLPRLDAAQRRDLLRRHFDSLGMGLCEAAMTWWSDEARILSLSRVEGLEHVERALAKGRGVIILTAHFTTIEIGARILNARVPINILYRPLKNRLLASTSGRHFERQARKAIQRDDVRSMIAALRRNEIVWYAPDQAYRKKGAEMVPFFGLPVATNVFTPRLAEMTGAEVLYYECERLPDAKGYVARVSPPLPMHGCSCAVEATRVYHARIEEQVRQCPEQYWWIHRRFKCLKATDPDYYGRRPPGLTTA
jgi:KDO2-lipid IV(A) lauroyltransferase